MNLYQKVSDWIKQSNPTPTQRATIVGSYAKHNGEWVYTGDCVGFADNVSDPAHGIPSVGVCFTLPNNIGICAAYTVTVGGKLPCMSIFVTPTFEPYIKKSSYRSKLL